MRNTVEKIDNSASDLQTASDDEGDDVTLEDGEDTVGVVISDEVGFLSRDFLAGVDVDWWW